MAISKETGWDNQTNLYWEISKKLERINSIAYKLTKGDFHQGSLLNPPLRWGLVSETDATPFNSDNVAGGGTNVTYRKTAYIHPCTNPKFVYVNAGRVAAIAPNKGYAEGLAANILPIPVQVSLERAIGTIYQTSLETVEPGIKYFDEFAGVEIEALEKCWIRNFVDQNSVATWRPSIFGLWGSPGFGWPVLTTGEGKGTGNLTSAGTCGPDYAASGTIGGASMVLGLVREKTGVLIIGDSTATYPYSVFDELGGWWQKAFHGVLPYASMGIGQDLAFNIATEEYSAMRMSFAQYCKTAILMAGINDTNNSRTANQIIADYITIAQKFKTQGIKTVYVTTISPSTTSTDGWLTVANQTVYGNDAVRQSVNSQLRAGALNGYATIIDVAAVTEVGTTGKWITDETVHFGPIVPNLKTGHKFTFTGQNFAVDQFKGMTLYSITDNKRTLITSNTATEIYTAPSLILVTDSVRVTNHVTVDGTHYSTFGSHLISQVVKTAYGI